MGKKQLGHSDLISSLRREEGISQKMIRGGVHQRMTDDGDGMEKR